MHDLPKNGFSLQMRTESGSWFCIRISNEAPRCFLCSFKKCLHNLLWLSRIKALAKIKSDLRLHLGSWDLICLVHWGLSCAFTCPRLLDKAVKVFCLHLHFYLWTQTYKYTRIHFWRHPWKDKRKHSSVLKELNNLSCFWNARIFKNI